jgi:hypothetical protein
MTPKSPLPLALALAAALMLALAGYGSARTAPDAPAVPAAAEAVLADLVVTLAVQVAVWAIDEALARHEDGQAREHPPAALDEPLRSRPSRPMMPFYSFASALPRPRGA